MLKRIRWWYQRYTQFLRRTILTLRLTLLPTAPLRAEDFAELDVFLTSVFEQHTDREADSFALPEWMHGNNQQAERLVAVSDYALQRWEGDILEIGAHKGRMTQLFAEVAKKHGRRVLVVDPWEIGTQNTDGGEYEEFLQAIAVHKDVVDVAQASSLAPSAIKQMQNRKLAFVFVDGLHTYEACLQDIISTQHCAGYIVIDDLIWSRECQIATMRGAAVTGREAVHHPMCREAYLLPLDNGRK